VRAEHVGHCQRRAQYAWLLARPACRSRLLARSSRKGRAVSASLPRAPYQAGAQCSSAHRAAPVCAKYNQDMLACVTVHAKHPRPALQGPVGGDSRPEAAQARACSAAPSSPRRASRPVPKLSAAGSSWTVALAKQWFSWPGLSNPGGGVGGRRGAACFPGWPRAQALWREAAAPAAPQGAHRRSSSSRALGAGPVGGARSAAPPAHAAARVQQPRACNHCFVNANVQLLAAVPCFASGLEALSGELAAALQAQIVPCVCLDNADMRAHAAHGRALSLQWNCSDNAVRVVTAVETCPGGVAGRDVLMAAAGPRHQVVRLPGAWQVCCR